MAAGLVGTFLGMALAPGAALADRSAASPGGQSGGLITLTAPLADHAQQLTVIDPQMKVMSVYHIELSTGQIVLKSVRNIHWDLQMVEFNGTSPLPREIRSLLEQK